MPDGEHCPIPVLLQTWPGPSVVLYPSTCMPRGLSQPSDWVPFLGELVKVSARLLQASRFLPGIFHWAPYQEQMSMSLRIIAVVGHSDSVLSGKVQLASRSSFSTQGSLRFSASDTLLQQQLARKTMYQVSQSALTDAYDSS
jgi:hypothetical protein